MNEIPVKEAAEYLKVSEKTIYRWIRQGVIPSFKFQGQYRFDKEELTGWARHIRFGSIPGQIPRASGEEARSRVGAVRLGGRRRLGGVY